MPRNQTSALIWADVDWPSADGMAGLPYASMKFRGSVNGIHAELRSDPHVAQKRIRPGPMPSRC